jgi:dethiobiotin synthase
MRYFLTGTGTDVGKTVVSTAIARALRLRGETIAAIKPVETGTGDGPRDALALAEACGRPALPHAAGLYRALLPVAPFAATLAGEPPPPALEDLASAIRSAWAEATHALVEGAGGPLVPYDAGHDLIELASRLELPVLLVASDSLGVLSHTFTAVESIRARGLGLSAVILNRFAEDPSNAHNLGILQARLAPLPVLPFEPRSLEPTELAAAAERAGLPALFASSEAPPSRRT